MNKIINKLLKLKKRGTQTQQEIARVILSYYDRKLPLKSGRQIAEEAFVSLAALTKFIKAMEFPDLKSFLYEFKKLVKADVVSEKISDNNEAIEVIKGARKVFFIGVGPSFHINSDFENKLSRLDYWTSAPNNKYDQVGQSRLLTSKDVLIVTTASFQHEWMKTIIANTKAKVIINSFQDIDFHKGTITINKQKGLETSSSRLTSTTHTIFLQENLYDLWNQLITDKVNKRMLLLTKY